jgi:serine/threonine-protein kinase RsbW
MQTVSRQAGTVRVAVRSEAHQVAESPACGAVKVPMSDGTPLTSHLAKPCLEMSAWPGAVPCARHHARQVLWDAGLKELIDPVELVVSEIITNAIRACGALDSETAVRLWLAVMEDGVLVMVWDASPSRPQRQSPAPEAEGGRGLLLVDAVSASWGSFELAEEPGKVVWALCAS